MPKLNTLNGRLSTLAAAFLEQLNRGIWDSADELFTAHGHELTDDEKMLIRIAGADDEAAVIALDFARKARYLLDTLSQHDGIGAPRVIEARQGLDKELKAFNL